MSKQRIMRTVIEDTTVLDRARKALRMGQVVYYQGEKLQKVKGGWEKVTDRAYANIVIRQC